ncbi:MAG: IS1380 family transposase [Acidobacteria bacterium]|nr:MAG: IS1380 family transposase [Acidobacteriota bacterium]
MTTECTQKSFEFHSLYRREVKAEFSGGKLTSDGGALLLRQVEARLGVIERFAGCFSDYRKPEWIEHSVFSLVSQRVYGLALGYEDLNDHEDLRRDPLMAVLAEKEDVEGEKRRQPQDKGKPLAGKSTLNRLELTAEQVSEQERYKKIALDPQAADRALVDCFLDSYRRAPQRIVLDLDATDDRLHGNQEGRFFHGYYRDYCYLPLYIFCGRHLLCSRLRRSNIDACEGSVQELERIVRQIRERWPKVRIVIRADSGFCREPIMAWCEGHGVDYVLGLAKNQRLTAELKPPMSRARARYEKTGRPARVFAHFQYQTLESWSRSRRVVGKAEYLDKGENPRFVVTSFRPGAWRARALYEQLYCARGEMENRIKEQQLELFADRTSAATMRANQIRLYFSSFAYTLMEGLRRLGLAGTEMAHAQCGTIRLKLLKIGAQIRVSVRRVLISLASGYPDQDLFRRVCQNLGPPVEN